MTQHIFDFKTLEFCPVEGGVILKVGDGFRVATIADLTTHLAQLCGLNTAVAHSLEQEPAVEAAVEDPQPQPTKRKNATGGGRPRADITEQRNALVAIRGKEPFTLKDVLEDERCSDLFPTEGKIAYFLKRAAEQTWLVKGKRTKRGYVYSWEDAVPAPPVTAATTTDPTPPAPDAPFEPTDEPEPPPESSATFPPMGQDDGETPAETAAAGEGDADYDPDKLPF